MIWLLTQCFKLLSFFYIYSLKRPVNKIDTNGSANGKPGCGLSNRNEENVKLVEVLAMRTCAEQKDQQVRECVACVQMDVQGGEFLVLHGQ